MAGFQCPSPTCDWQISLAIEPDAPLLIIAKREASDTRFRIYASAGGVFEELMLLTWRMGGGADENQEPERTNWDMTGEDSARRAARPKVTRHYGMLTESPIVGRMPDTVQKEVREQK